MSRIVKVSTPQSDRMKTVNIDEDVTTWGELQEAFMEAGISVAGVNAVVRETKVTLESKDAQLPDGDFTVFLFTAKVKSGIIDTKALIEDMKQKFEGVFEEILENFEDGTYGEDDGETDSEDESPAQERKRLARELGH